MQHRGRVVAFWIATMLAGIGTAVSGAWPAQADVCPESGWSQTGGGDCSTFCYGPINCGRAYVGYINNVPRYGYTNLYANGQDCKSRTKTRTVCWNGDELQNVHLSGWSVYSNWGQEVTAQSSKHCPTGWYAYTAQCKIQSDCINLGLPSGEIPTPP